MYLRFQQQQHIVIIAEPAHLTTPSTQQHPIPVAEIVYQTRNPTYTMTNTSSTRSTVSMFACVLVALTLSCAVAAPSGLGVKNHVADGKNGLLRTELLTRIGMIPSSTKQADLAALFKCLNCVFGCVYAEPNDPTTQYFSFDFCRNVRCKAHGKC